MSLVKLFDFLEEDLSPRLVFEDLDNFHSKIDEPIFEYYTYDSVRGNMEHNYLMDFLANMGEDLPEYYFLVDKEIFKNLNKKFDSNIPNYGTLVDLKNDSDFLEKYVLFEECLDRVLENILESELRVFYSKEANEFVRTLEGEKLENLLGVNSYLKKIYLDENK
jgi:hypothetical protein